jgi:hypothetical protein
MVGIIRFGRWPTSGAGIAVRNRHPPQRIFEARDVFGASPHLCAKMSGVARA